MMGKLGELHFDLRVAASTQLFLLMATDFLLWPLVQLVTVKAADIIQRMHAGIPTGQVWSRGCGVAFQAKHRLCLSREIVYRQQGLEVADFRLCGMFNSDAARAMT